MVVGLAQLLPVLVELLEHCRRGLAVDQVGLHLRQKLFSGKGLMVRVFLQWTYM